MNKIDKYYFKKILRYFLIVLAVVVAIAAVEIVLVVHLMNGVVDSILSNTN